MMIQSKIEEIGPETASFMLSRNDANRPCDMRRAARIAGDILRGEWKVNGDAIRISKTGRLLDGQHRLNAVIISGKAIDTLVVRGLDDKVFDTIDVNNKSRTTGDILSIKGYKHYNALAAVARSLHIYRSSGAPIHGNPDHQPTTSQIERLVESDPAIQEVVNDAACMKWCKQYLTITSTGLCLYLFRLDSRRLADEFFQKLETGANLEHGSPIIFLRDRLIASRLDKLSKMSPIYRYAIVFKAYKLFRDGDLIKTLRVRMEGDAPEKNIFIL